MKISSIISEDRPREKLANVGVRNLTDSELLAILLQSGNQEESVLELSTRILKDYSLDQLDEMKLKSYKGVGFAKSSLFAAVIEWGRRRQVKIGEKLVVKIHQSADVFELVKSDFYALDHEEFWVVFLDQSNKVIKKKRFGVGGVAGTIVDVKIIMKDAVNLLSSSIVLCHNHPSGNLKPSKSDYSITDKIQGACKLFDIRLLDHLIIHDHEYISFQEKGWI